MTIMHLSEKAPKYLQQFSVNRNEKKYFKIYKYIKNK